MNVNCIVTFTQEFADKLFSILSEWLDSILALL